jgi:hypothetical protein
MLSLDLFKSKFEQQIHEGAVDSVVEQTPENPNQPYVANFNEFNTPENISAVRDIWTRIQAHFMDEDSTWQWLTLKWPDNSEAVTLSPNQVFSILKKIASMSNQKQKVTLLTNFGNRNNFLSWLSGVKVTPRPVPKKDVPRGQQSLDLKELDQKKSSDDPKYKDVRVQRAMRQAAADYPTAGSDAEAFAKSMLDAQDQDQENIAKLRQSTQRQRDLLDKNDRLDQRQQQMLGSLEKEINDVEQTNTSLEKTLQQMQQANVALQRRLDQMRGKPVVTPTIPVEPGVSVATDKVPATPAPVTTPAIDPRARRYAQQLRKQLNQLQTMVALKAPEDPGQLNQLQQKIDTLTAQLAKLQQQEPIATATPATVGGEPATVLGKQTSADTEIQTSTDDNDFTMKIDPAIAAAIKNISDKSKSTDTKKTTRAKKKATTEARSADAIPLKSVVQGYTVEYNPRTKQVTVSRGGQVIGTGVNRLNSPNYHLTLVNRIIDQAEEDKYPTDIDVRDVALPMKQVGEGSVFGQQDFDTQMDLAKLKSQLTQPKPAQSAPASAEPQPVPARLSDLQAKKEKINNLASIKKEIERLQARATRGGRMLPRGLAADLEDYFTTADIDTAYDDMIAKYQKQLGALQQYLGMRKALWTPKKDVHEMKISELNETKSEVWTVHFTDGTAVRVRVSDETDPAAVRKHYANKGKTVKKFDYGFGVDQPAGPGPEPHEPGSGTAVSARTGERLPEGRAGYNPLQTEKDWHEVERYLSSMINDRTLDPETRAEARQRYLEKRKEAQQKGWAK